MATRELFRGAQRRARTWRYERNLSATASRVRSERLTYLRPDRLETLERLSEEMNDQRIVGDVIECGVALGGSTVVLAASMGSTRTLHAYDVFGMIPAPTASDPPEVHERYATIISGRSSGIGGDDYYGYRDDLEDHVAATLNRYRYPVGVRVHLHKGLFEDTLRPEERVALAHIDCDWHDPVKLCLNRIGAELSPGGTMVLDDYTDYDGARSATDAYLREHPEMTLVRFASNVGVRRVR